MNLKRRALAGALAVLGGSAVLMVAPAFGMDKPTAPKPAAAPAGPALPSLTAEQIVQKNIAARGGAGAWKAIQSISYTGSLDAGRVRPDNGLHPSATERLLDKPGKSTKAGQAPAQHLSDAEAGTPVSLPYALYMQRPNKQRVELKFKDETLVQVYDGKAGWKLQPYLRRGVLPFSAEELRKARDFQEIDGMLVDYAAKGSKVALDGTDVVEGKPAYRLKVTLKNGDVRRVWIDAQSFLDVQVDGARRLNGHEVAQYTAMRDYRSVNGVLVPFLMETRTDGQTEREKIVVEKVALNPKFDAGFFSKPN